MTGPFKKNAYLGGFVAGSSALAGFVKLPPIDASATSRAAWMEEVRRVCRENLMELRNEPTYEALMDSSISFEEFAKRRDKLGRVIRDRAVRRKMANDQIQDEIDRLNDIVAWASTVDRLQCPKSSRLHLLLKAIKTNQIWIPSNDEPVKEAIQNILNREKELQSYLIQTDWAGAFRNAQDYGGGELHLPGDNCAFEMRISDQHVIVLVSKTEGETARGLILVETTTHSWVIYTFTSDITSVMGEVEDGTSRDRISMIIEQIRAACVAMDAQVVLPELQARDRKYKERMFRAGQLPEVSHHILKLNRKHRRYARAELDPDRQIQHRRLHFRRGHWRRFADPQSGQERWTDPADGKEKSRTRIPWMLVGDPDLGWIEKEYRL